MTGFENVLYTGLFPVAKWDFNENDELVSNISVFTYSFIVPQDIKNSSMPVAFIDVNIENSSDYKINASVMLSFSDIIGRGIKDTNKYNLPDFNLDGNSDFWYFMEPPKTKAENINISDFSGVSIKSSKPLTHSKWTLQNYNDSFVVLGNGGKVTTIKKYNISDESVFPDFISKGVLKDVNFAKNKTENNIPNSASAVAINVELNPKENKTIRFMIAWFMSEPDQDEINSMPKNSRHLDMNYGRYYHNYFSNIEQLSKYAISNREKNLQETLDWQIPILKSSLPDFLKFKVINSAYTIFTNTVLNKDGDFSVLEGGMGGLGGTMDQKLSSHPFCQKFFTELDANENQQFANYPENNGEIPHFDMHYYDGINSHKYKNKSYINGRGSMIDNTGSWLLQLMKNYAQTGDVEPVINNYLLIKSSMNFFETRFDEDISIPNWYTTYDDLPHPKGFIFSGILYLVMLNAAKDAAIINKDIDFARKCEAIYEKTAKDIDKLYINEDENGYYAYGFEKDSTKPIEEIIHAGTLAGQFISRYSGFGDVIELKKAEGALTKFMTTAIQNSPDYYSPKVYNFKSEEFLDMIGSSCWPFYQDSYIAMPAIQLGYIEDGLTLLEYTQKVHGDRGFLWTQSLWTPAYLSYMTSPVSWFVNDVLAGFSVDFNNKNINIGLAKISDTGMIPLYYPTFWAELEYDFNKKTAFLKITRIFGDKEFEVDKITALPTGVPFSNKKEINLDFPFVIKKGNILDISKHFNLIANGVKKDKILKPVPAYTDRKPARVANGTGLKAEYFSDSNFKDLVKSDISETISLKLDDSVKSIIWHGFVLPKYEQNYIFTVISDGKVRLFVDNNKIIDNQNNNTLNKLDGEYAFKDNKVYPIKLEVSDASEIELRWWSTTQTSDIIQKYRLYPPIEATEPISSLKYDIKSDGIMEENDHIGYIRNKGFMIFSGIDFKEGISDFKIKVSASSATKGGNLTFSYKNEKGEYIPLSTIKIYDTGNWNNFIEFTADNIIKEKLLGYNIIRLDFSGDDEFLFNIRDFSFVK